MVNLIIPKDQRTKDKEDKEDLSATFHERLQGVLDKNGDKDHPYFILFRAEQKDMQMNRFVERFVVYLRKPPFIVNSMVFFVDNKRELLSYLWTCDPDKNLKFNKQMTKSEIEAFESAADFQRAFYKEARSHGQDKEKVLLRA